MIAWTVFAICGALVVLLLVLPKKDPVEMRLEGLEGDTAVSLRGRGARSAVTPPTIVQDDRQQRRRGQREDKKQPSLRERLIQAGIYSLATGVWFSAFRYLSSLCLLALVAYAWHIGALSPLFALVLGVCGVLIALMAPSFMLDYLKSRRQNAMRRALPDALDTIVICLEGGLGLGAALSRVAGELVGAHPMLAVELKIVEREVQMGRTTGEALRGLSSRFDLEELRSMASVILYAERYGASVTKALNVYAETMRQKRTQRAEQKAHKAAVWLLIPTGLCVFPALFVVLLGPAVIQIWNVLFPILEF